MSHFSVTQDSNKTAKTNVHIEWNPPVLRDLNGVIQKYYIQYWYQKNQKMVKFIFFNLPIELFFILVEMENLARFFNCFIHTLKNIDCS